MKKLLFVICLNLVSDCVQAQVIDDYVKHYIETQKIDSFLVYSEYCNGFIMPYDSCLNETVQYLFTHKNQQTCLVKVDDCNIFCPLVLSTNNPLMFYIKNVDSINKEIIKPPAYITKKRRKSGYEFVETGSVSLSHSCFYIFKSPVFDTNIRVNDFDLTFKFFDNGYQNMYYEHNQKTQTCELINLTNSLIKQLEQEKKFIKK